VAIMHGPPQSAAPFVVFETSVGVFVVELYTRHAQNTCYNFSELARAGYYNRTVFHRVIKDFMVQGGDPTGTGRGGESVFGGKFGDEITRELKHVGAGVLAMANSGPNTNGSQFYLTLAPAPWLDGKHTVFGRVCSGMGTVKKLGLVPVDGGDRPLTDVFVHRAYPSATAELPAAGGGQLATVPQPGVQ
jgi:peptidyl-prolyl cis-trans isomerase-like 1